MSKHHMIKRSLATAAALAAAGFPATAQAWPVEPNPDEQVAVAPSGATVNPGRERPRVVLDRVPRTGAGAVTMNEEIGGSVARATKASGGRATESAAYPIVRPNPDEQVPPSSTSVSPAIVRVRSHNGGFDWGDAGNGAAGTAVLLGACLFGAAMTRRRRTQRSAAS